MKLFKFFCEFNVHNIDLITALIIVEPYTLSKTKIALKDMK